MHFLRSGSTDLVQSLKIGLLYVGGNRRWVPLIPYVAYMTNSSCSN